MKTSFVTRYLLMFLIITWTISALAQQDSAGLFQEGKFLFKQGKWAEACSRFEIITATSQTSDEAWYAIGLCKIKLDDENGARKALHRISDNSMNLKEKLGKILKATASKRLSRMPMHKRNDSAQKSATGTLPDDPTCQANRKVIAGAITMYSMNTRQEGKLPHNIFDLLKQQHLLKQDPECPAQGTFSVYQKDSNIRVVCSAHGTDDESCTSLPDTIIAIPQETLIASKEGSKPATNKSENPMRDMPLAELEKLAETGSAQAQIELALRYRGGRRGVKKDEQRARAWLEKAAEQGDARGMTELGLLLWSKEKELATTWLEKAAAQDNKASHFLGNIHNIEYLSNRSLKNEKEEAQKWYAVGAERAYPPSVVKLFHLKYAAQIIAITPEEAEPLKQAAIAGYPPAMKKYSEIAMLLAGLQSNDDYQVEGLAWQILYTKFEPDSYEKEKAAKYYELIQSGTPDEIKKAGEKLAAELEPQIPQFKEE